MNKQSLEIFADEFENSLINILCDNSFSGACADARICDDRFHASITAKSRITFDFKNDVLIILNNDNVVNISYDEKDFLKSANKAASLIYSYALSENVLTDEYRD